MAHRKNTAEAYEILVRIARKREEEKLKAERKAAAEAARAAIRRIADPILWNPICAPLLVGLFGTTLL